MYLGYQNGKIKFYTEQPLDTIFYNIDRIEKTQDEYILDGEEYVLKDEQYEAKQALIEKERIQNLSMTRSDFFDGTIRAFGLGKNELQIAIESVLSNLNISEIEKAVALNNYENALNFYRKHPLFTMLSGVKIPISIDSYILITSEQWDKFFDETNKKNPDSYKELIAITVEPEVE